MEPIILASSSPRRQEILKLLNIPFQVIIPEIDEKEIAASCSISETSEKLALAKIDAVIKQISANRKIPWVLAADTTVEIDEKIYGKPESNEDAVAFMHVFNGRTHIVRTSIALYNSETKKILSRNVCTKVTFAQMSDDEIDWYVSTGEWHGVAGGYRIQGLASCYITKIEGTASCVAGLPMFELYDMLKSQGYSILE